MLSNPLYLRLNPFYAGWPRLAPQMALGTDVAYALVQDHPYASVYADDWGPPKVVAFDPVTLAPLLTTYLDQDQEQYLLHSVSASGAAVVTGPETGNTQEVAPGVQASIEPAVALHAEAEQGVANAESPYWAGNPQGQHAIRTYFDVETAAISILREILPISNLLGREMGGEICTNDFGKHFVWPPARGVQGQVYSSRCLGFPAQANYHTHPDEERISIPPTPGTDGPSSVDVTNRYADGLVGYIGVATDSTPDQSIDCAPRAMGNIWKYALDQTVPLDKNDPDYRIDPIVVACSPR